MTLIEFLNRAGNIQEYSRKSKVLLFGYYLRQYQGTVEFSTSDIRDCFQTALLKTPSNLSKLLKELARGRSSPLMKGGRAGRYSLTLPGLNEVEAYLTTKEEPESEVGSFLKSAIPHLQKVIAKIVVPDQKEFMAESIACLGVDAKRATIIMAWAGAVAHMYDYILADKKRLSAFNDAIKKRSDKYKNVVVSLYDDFSEISDVVFIEVCRSARLITNDVRKILDEKLGVRNTCAHPSGVEVHKTKVINFVEDLVDNVVRKYKLK
jgi:hypothetical protein